MFINDKRFSSNKICSTKNLKHFEQALENNEVFFRVHHKYIINTKFIKSFDKQNSLVMLKNGQKIPVSQRKRTPFVDFMRKNLMNWYYHLYKNSYHLYKEVITIFLILGILGLGETGTSIIMFIIVIPVATFYNLISEIYFNGQTIGKKALDIKVVKITGEKPSLGDFFIRWTYRIVDIFLSAGGIAAIFVSASDKGQRLGDLAANTSVIKLKPNSNANLKDILRISNNKEYIPTYSNVTQLSDEDMLLIKNSLIRVKKYPNEANKNIIKDLIIKIQTILGIDVVPKNKIQFFHEPKLLNIICVL